MDGKALCNLKTLGICEVSMRVTHPQGLGTIQLSPSDQTQKPELYIPDIPVAGKPVALTCTIRGSCIETEALFLSWKEHTKSFDTDGSRNNNSSSMVLHITPKPEDHDTTLQCHLNFSLPNSTRISRFSPISECYWAREDPESEKNDEPKRNT